MNSIKTPVTFHHQNGANKDYILNHDKLYELGVRPNKTDPSLTLLEIGTELNLSGKKYKITKMSSKFFQSRDDSGTVDGEESIDYPSYNFEIVYWVDDIA